MNAILTTFSWALAVLILLLTGGCVPPPPVTQQVSQNRGYAPAYPQYQVAQPQVMVGRNLDAERGAVPLSQGMMAVCQ